MAAKHDAVINELNFKIDKLIKLYISSLEQNKSLESKIQDLQSELENLQRDETICKYMDLYNGKVLKYGIY